MTSENGEKYPQYFQDGDSLLTSDMNEKGFDSPAWSSPT